MAIEFEVADISGVDEEIRSAYVEKDGKFILDPDRYHELRAAPLIAKNKELLSEKKKLAEAKAEVERLKKGAETDVEKVAAEKEQRIAILENQVREYSIWTPVQELAVKHGAKADSLEALTTLLRVQNRFDLEDGKLVYKDRDGYTTTTKPARAFETYLRDEFPWAFEASKAAGSGAQNGSRGSSSRTVSRDAFNSMTQEQRDKAIAEKVRIVE
jgi:hypothetical protein